MTVFSRTQKTTVSLLAFIAVLCGTLYLAQRVKQTGQDSLRPTTPSKLTHLFLIDVKPINLTPFWSLDANGQRLGALLFRALTKLDINLDVVPDLASGYFSSDRNSRWTFPLQSSLGKDSLGRPITEHIIFKCLNQYFFSNKPSPLVHNMAPVRDIQLENRSVVFKLEHADPYFPRNLTLFRLFYESSLKGPCESSGPNDSFPEVFTSEFKLTPSKARRTGFILTKASDPKRSIEIQPIKDETSRAIQLFSGRGDFTLNAFSSARHAFIESRHHHHLKLTTFAGTSVSYLVFNTQSDALKNVSVRKAMALATLKYDYVKFKLFQTSEVAESFLHPSLFESYSKIFYGSTNKNALELAESVLETSGFKRDSHGVRLRATLTTSNYRDNEEYALFFKQNLNKIGVHLDLDIVDFATSLNKMRSGRFEIGLSRWVGIQDGSILWRSLHSKSKDNRARYVSQEVDSHLEQAWRSEPEVRLNHLKRVQIAMQKDFPYVPLWFWKNQLIFRSNLLEYDAVRVSPIGDFLFLKELFL